MAQVSIYTNSELPDLLSFVKNCIADATGRYEPTIFATLHRAQSARLGASEKVLFIRVHYIGAADTFRTQKILQFVCYRIVYKYQFPADDIYVTFVEQQRAEVFIGGQMA